MILEGLIYQSLKKFDYAIKAFELAVLMEPKRLRARYYLMVLYDSTANITMTKYWAKQILTTPIKIISFDTNFMTREAKRITNK